MANKEVARRETDSVAILPADLAGDWGTESVDSTDIVIPKLLLMHPTSELVQGASAQGGDLVRSTDNVKLGDKNKPVKLIPFMMFKTWVENKFKDGQYRWDHERPYTAENSNDAWEYELNGDKWKRQKALNFYALLLQDIASSDGFPLPIKLQFKSASLKAGRVLANHFGVCKMMKKPPVIKIFNIGSELVKGDKNTYQVFTVAVGENSTIEQMQACKSWYTTISESIGKVKDHNVSDAETIADDGKVDVGDY